MANLADNRVFRLVDRATLVAALTQRLRTAGIEVGLSSADRFGQALSECPPRDTATLYWLARTCLLHDQADVATFNAVFGAIFEGDELPVAPSRQRDARPVVVKARGTVMRRSVPIDTASGRVADARRSVIVDGAADEAAEADPRALPELLPSSVSELADTPFDQLSDHELDLLGTWLREVAPKLPSRRSRRYRSTAHGGSVDLRRTMRAARQTGGEAICLERRQPRRKPRNVVMVADLSGSMQSFSRIYLHLMRSLVLGLNAEAFAFCTSLRRVTIALGEGDSQQALGRLADAVTDRFGGTRIGASLGELIASPVWSNTLRGAVVVIVSDGWEADSPDELALRMQRLQRMAHRVMWVNPRSAAPDYEPLVGGMAAALPYTDQVFSGHTLNTMRDVIGALA